MSERLRIQRAKAPTEEAAQPELADRTASPAALEAPLVPEDLFAEPTEQHASSRFEDSFRDALHQSSPGEPLDPETRRYLEPGFGHNFADLRIHADHDADQLSRSVDATAFTTGSDIFFRANAYNPHSLGGLYVLAHEAAHTVQQAGGPEADDPPPGGIAISDPSDSAEQAADRAAGTVLGGGQIDAQAMSASSPGTTIQRLPAMLDAAPVRLPTPEDLDVRVLVGPVVETIAGAIQADPADRSGSAKAQLDRLAPPAREAAMAQLPGKVPPAHWQTFTEGKSETASKDGADAATGDKATGGGAVGSGDESTPEMAVPTGEKALPPASGDAVAHFAEHAASSAAEGGASGGAAMMESTPSPAASVGGAAATAEAPPSGDAGATSETAAGASPDGGVEAESLKTTGPSSAGAAMTQQVEQLGAAGQETPTTAGEMKAEGAGETKDGEAGDEESDEPGTMRASRAGGVEVEASAPSERATGAGAAGGETVNTATASTGAAGGEAVSATAPASPAGMPAVPGAPGMTSPAAGGPAAAGGGPGGGGPAAAAGGGGPAGGGGAGGGGTAPAGATPPGGPAAAGGGGPADGGAAPGAAAPEAAPAPAAATPTATGVEALRTGDLALVDEELAEHERWGAATATVGAAGSEQRAEFIAQQTGAGLISGFGEGFKQGFELGLVETFCPVPGVGAVIMGVQSLKGLTEGWDHTKAAVAAFGQGSDVYETIANSIAAVSAIIEVVTNVLGILNGILGVIEIGLWAITVGAAVAAIFTLGAAAGIAVMAGEAAEVVTEIKEAVGIAMMVLGGINSLILQPVVLLFRAMHTFTSQADPRAVEAQGAGLKQSAGSISGFLGGLAGAAAAGALAPEEEEAPPPSPEPEPTPAAMSGPEVAFDEPPAGATGDPAAAPAADPAVNGEPPQGPRAPGETDPIPVDDDPTLVDEKPPDTIPDENAPDTVPDEITELPEGSAMQADTPEGTREMYENSLRDDPGREVALYTNTETGEVIAVQGDAGGVPIDHGVWREAFPGNPDAWQLEAHSHPVDPNTGVTPFPERLPSSTGGDFSVIEAESQASGNQPRTSRIDVMTDNGPNHTEFTYDPNDPHPYKIDYPDPVTGERTQVEFASKEAYEEWYSDNFPGRQAQIDPEPVGVPSSGDPVPGSAVPGGADDVPTGPSAPKPLPEDPSLPPERSNSERLQGPRAQARAEAIAEIREAIQSGTSDSPRVRYAMERIEAVYGREALVQFGETGVPPPGMEFSHLFSASEYPEFAGHMESGVLTDARDHRVGHHGGDTSEPLHGDPRDPNWEENWGSQEGDLSSANDRRYAGMTDDDAPQSVDSQLAQDYPQLANQLTGSGGGPPAGPGRPQRGAARPPPVPPPEVLPPTPKPPGETPTGSGGSTPAGSGGGAAANSAQGAATGGARIIAHYPGSKGGAPKSASAPAKRTKSRLPKGSDVHMPVPPDKGGEGAKSHVEPVNPNYPNPPGTPQQLKQIQADISQTLANRAKAEQAEAKMNAQAQEHQANRALAQQAVQGTQQAMTATQAHEKDVAMRDAANKAQQQKQEQSQGTVATYADKAAGLAALTGPLTAFRAFTSLASHLPGDAGAAMAKMAADGDNVQKAFDQMEVKMAEQATGLPLRQQELQGDNARIQASGQEGQAATADLQKSQEGAEAFEAANTQKIEEATAGKAQAAGEKTRLGAEAQEKEQKGATLAEQLQAWATAHKAARVQAIEETKQKLQAEGKIVTGAKEK